jgi:tRNA 2-thiouridine synthesizing protein A
MTDSPEKTPALNARATVTVQSDEILVDARGHRCPTPTLRLQKALKAAGPGATVRLLADDPMARIDVPHFLNAKGYPAPEIAAEDDWLSFTVVTPA